MGRVSPHDCPCQRVYGPGDDDYGRRPKSLIRDGKELARKMGKPPLKVEVKMNEDLTLKQVKRMRRNLENTLNRRLREFTEQTGIVVQGIHLTITQSTSTKESGTKTSYDARIHEVIF